MAHLRSDDTLARLAAGFGIGATTGWRYIREAVDLLAAAALTLTRAMVRIERLAYLAAPETPGKRIVIGLAPQHDRPPPERADGQGRVRVTTVSTPGPPRRPRR